MENNKPIDKSALMRMLGNSKKIMDKVESGNFEPGHVDNRVNQTSENLVENIDPNKMQVNSNYAQTHPNGIPQTHMNATTTKMDPRIVKAMMENPIIPEQAHQGGTFSMDDVRDAGLAGKRPQQYQTPPQQVNEYVQQRPLINANGEKLITISESELDAKIKDMLLEFMTTTFVKTLSENTIKKTISTLIKEGKIRVKAK